MRKISLLVSKNCFGNCTGCYLDHREGEELSLKEITRLAYSLKDSGYKGITISGGDPLTRKDVTEIIDVFYSLNFIIHLDTTGTPLLEVNFRDRFLEAEMSKKISLIGIPIDGSTQNTIQEFRTGWDNMQEETDKILMILDENNFQISINTVIHKNNINDLNNIYEKIIKYPKVQRWELHQFISLSEKSKNIKNQLEVSDSEFSKAIKRIINYKDIVISPKPSANKGNFKYIDFNGDIVIVKNKIKKITGSIKGLYRQELEALLK